MPIGLQGFNVPRADHGRPAEVIDKPGWGPPDMAKMLQEGIGGLYDSYRAAYNEKQQSKAFEDLARERAASLSPGQQAAGLNGPGGMYGSSGNDTLGGSSGAFSAGGNQPLRAGGIGAGGPEARKRFQTQDPVAGDLTPEQRALLNGIAGPESGGKYNIRYTPQGGATFELGDQHPGVMEPTHGGKKSSAAGRYQFTKTTWDGLTGGNVPFTPENQDRMAVKLAQRDYAARTGRDLDADLQAEGFSPRIQAALKPTWAGIAGGNAGRVNATYQESLQRYASGGPAQPANAPPVPGSFTESGVQPRNTGAGPVPTIAGYQPPAGVPNAAPAPAQAAPQGDQTVLTPETIANARRILQQPDSTPPMKTWAAQILEKVGDPVVTGSTQPQQPGQTAGPGQTATPPTTPPVTQTPAQQAPLFNAVPAPGDGNIASDPNVSPEVRAARERLSSGVNPAGIAAPDRSLPIFAGPPGAAAAPGGPAVTLPPEAGGPRPQPATAAIAPAAAQVQPQTPRGPQSTAVTPPGQTTIPEYTAPQPQQPQQAQPTTGGPGGDTIQPQEQPQYQPQPQRPAAQPEGPRMPIENARRMIAAAVLTRDPRLIAAATTELENAGYIQRKPELVQGKDGQFYRTDSGMPVATGVGGAAKLVTLGPNDPGRPSGADNRTPIIVDPSTGKWEYVAPPASTDQWQTVTADPAKGTYTQRNTKTGEIKVVGKAGTEVNIAGPEKTYDQKVAGSFADTYINSQKAGDDANRVLTSLAFMESEMKKPGFYSGPGSEWLKTGQRLASELGLAPRDYASPNELFTALTREVTLGKLGGNLGAGVSNTDVSFINEVSPSLANTTEGNKKIMGYTRRVALHAQKVAKFARDYVARNGRIDAGYNQELAEWAVNNPIFKPEEMDRERAEIAASKPSAPGDRRTVITPEGGAPAQAAPAQTRAAPPPRDSKAPLGTPNNPKPVASEAEGDALDPGVVYVTPTGKIVESDGSQKGRR